MAGADGVELLIKALADNVGRYLPILLLLVSAALLYGLLTPAGAARTVEPVAKPFLTRRESAMLDILETMLPSCRIHAQVAMGALLTPPRRSGERPRAWERNAYAQKIVDFVVQDRASGAILALIEVDDSSHDAERDRQRDAMTAGAGYRTIRIPASARPTLAAVGRAIEGLACPPSRSMASGD